MSDILDDNSLQAIGQGLSIIEKYHRSYSEFSDNPVIIQEDIIKLEAIQALLSTRVGFLNGMEQVADDLYKAAKAAVVIQSKTVRDNIDTDIHVTEKDIEAISRNLTQNILDEKIKTTVTAEIARSAYFSIKAFASALENNLKRLYAERSKL